MKKGITFSLFLVTVSLFSTVLQSQDATVKVKGFDKIIVSPHIQVNLVEGDGESVAIENAKVSDDKINIKVEGNTLRIYLDGAKTVTKSEKRKNSSGNWKKSIYNGTMLTATITYKKLNSLSIRGEEIVKALSPFNQNDLKLSIYGEAKVYLNKVTVAELTVAIYGESYLEIASGAIEKQSYKAYGESEVNTMDVENETTKITAYGESNFRVNVSDKLKVTCYGETTINYKGDAMLDKGLIIGEASIRKIG